MRAEGLLSKITPQSASLEPSGDGGNTLSHDDPAAYLAGISDSAMRFIEIVYLGGDTPRNRRTLYLDVLQEVSKDWQPVGTKPTNPEKLREWQRWNTGLIEKLTNVCLDEWKTSTNSPTQWRAKHFGVSPAKWRHTYQPRYEKIDRLVAEYDSEFRRRCAFNSIDPEDLIEGVDRASGF